MIEKGDTAVSVALKMIKERQRSQWHRDDS